jgi:hypothetical protein
VAAHVRRVRWGAGTGHKPKYAAIPLCHYHHQLQHQKGESALAPREWWDARCIAYVSEWAWGALKATLGYEHWNQVPPDVLAAWAEENGVAQYLPMPYRRERAAVGG